MVKFNIFFIATMTDAICQGFNAEQEDTRRDSVHRLS